METFQEYLSEQNILQYLCKLRAKKAKERNKKQVIHQLTSDPSYNYHAKKNANEELYSLFPSRRKWIKLGKENRERDGYPLNSIQKNILILKKTINHFKKVNPQEGFLKNLNIFTTDLIACCYDTKFNFSKPEIFPKSKDGNKKEAKCRPISNYPLRDKIIICIVNKYFTDLFDKYFQNCSYAFRSAINFSGKVLSHHDAVERILKFQQQYKNDKLYVAECDISKFYDTVNHTIIKKAFKRLIIKVKREQSQFYSNDAERLFLQYLKSYTFNKIVYPLNKANDFFKKHGFTNSCFAWVEQELKQFYRV